MKTADDAIAILGSFSLKALSQSKMALSKTTIIYTDIQPQPNPTIVIGKYKFSSKEHNPYPHLLTWQLYMFPDHSLS